MRRALTALAIAPWLMAGSLEPIGPGYQPVDKDERGMWLATDEAERRLKGSSFVIQDPALNAYVKGVFCRTVGQAQCRDVRFYIVSEAQFNAFMAPNGMMVVYTGLLLRVRNEAQLAAVLGHEYTHYRNRHQLQEYRLVKNATNWFNTSFLLSLPVLSYFSYSREKEAEADAGGLEMMAHAGYDPNAAAEIWEHKRAEAEAAAQVRNTKPRYNEGGFFADHPTSLERISALKAQAATLHVDHAVTNEAEYRAAMAPWQARFLDDQIKRNDLGGTEFLLKQLAETGWTGPLLYARGELYRARGRPEDLNTAADYYRQSSSMADAPPEAWRGLGLSLLRQGDKAGGQAALKTYLSKRSDAPDRAMMQMLAGGAV